MKRIRAAVLHQIVHFQLRDGIFSDADREQVQKEYSAYKAELERNDTKFKILKEEVQPDGSILIEIKKQYNRQAIGDFLN